MEAASATAFFDAPAAGMLDAASARFARRHGRGAAAADEEVDADAAAASSSSSSSAAAAAASSARDAAEYAAFLVEEQRKEAAQNAREAEETAKALTVLERDKEYKQALSVLDDTLSRATSFNAAMAGAEKDMFSDLETMDAHVQPSLLTGGALRDYQMAGFQWLTARWLSGESGILADEMGLGKTVQVIAFVCWLWKEFEAGNRAAEEEEAAAGGGGKRKASAGKGKAVTAAAKATAAAATKAAAAAARAAAAAASAAPFKKLFGAPAMMAARKAAAVPAVAAAAAAASAAAAAVSANYTTAGKPVLIVGPLSTVGNWVAELARFAPTLPVVCYRGTPPEREALRKRHIPPAAFTTDTFPGGMPVFVTSYHYAVSDARVLSRVHWRVLVVDEGHRLKNESCVLREILKTYSREETGGSSFLMKLLLTGTPVQNDVMELWSLCNFVMPAVFRKREEFKRIYRFIGLGTTAGSSFIKSQVGGVGHTHTIHVCVMHSVSAWFAGAVILYIIAYNPIVHLLRSPVNLSLPLFHNPPTTPHATPSRSWTTAS